MSSQAPEVRDSFCMQDIQTERIGALERRQRLLLVGNVWIGLALIAIIATNPIGRVGAQEKQGAKPLTVSELSVVDERGVVRVRIGGNLPDAVIGGKVRPRGNKAAGVLLYDATGQERGGYVTWEPSGNVGLTLDTKSGQVALFVADRESGAALQLWHGNDSVELRSDVDGSRLTAVKAGHVVIQDPGVSMGPEACTAYRDARSRVPREQVFEECLRRFTAAACGACLGD